MRRSYLLILCTIALSFAFAGASEAQSSDPAPPLKKSDVQQDLTPVPATKPAPSPATSVDDLKKSDFSGVQVAEPRAGGQAVITDGESKPSAAMQPGVTAGFSGSGAVKGGAGVQTPTAQAPKDDPAVLQAEIKASAEVDRRMLIALENEYGVSRATPASPPRAPGRKFEVASDVEDREEDWVRIRFTLSFWAAELNDAEVSSRNGLAFGSFDPADEGVGNFDAEGAAIYQFEIGFHPVISLVASYYQIDFGGEQELNQNLLFENRGFAAGTRVSSEVELTSADAYLSIHALRGDLVRLDFMLGARYFKSEITYATEEVAVRRAFEAVTPILGLGLVVSPFDCVELYGSLLGGGMEYGRSRRRNSDSNRSVDERSIAVATLDMGLRINYQNNFGVALGYRADSFEVERNRGEGGSSKFEGTLGGPYFSIFLGF